jgi:hypothetical protein
VRFRATGGSAEWLTAFTRDIGVGGAFIETDQPVPAGTMLEVELDVPGPGPALTLAAEVRWVLEPSEAKDAPSGPASALDAAMAPAPATPRAPGMGVKFGALEVDALLALSDYFATLAGTPDGGGEARGP